MSAAVVRAGVRVTARDIEAQESSGYDKPWDKKAESDRISWRRIARAALAAVRAES